MAADPARVALLAGQNWNQISKELTRFAYGRCKSLAKAEDAAQDAIRKAYDPEHAPWDPEKEPSLTRFLMSKVNTYLANERTSARARRDVPFDDEPEDDKELRDPRALSEAAVVESDLVARKVARLRAALREDPKKADELCVLEHMEDGHDTPAALVAVTGWPYAKVDAARRRLFYLAAKVARELGDDQEEGEDA